MTRSEAAFLPGLTLSRVLYEEAVRPLIEAEWPGLRYAAARVGTGSEVLGFDSARSADHEWGPRLDLFLTAEDAAAHGERIHRLLAERLPKEVRGWPTHFRPTADPRDPVGLMTPTDGPVNHRVSVGHVGGRLRDRLGLTPGPAPAELPPAELSVAELSVAELSVTDWLSMPQQALAEFTGGAVFHDGLGELTGARRLLAWYPDQVWRHLLACQWQRISQEEAFPGRCAEAGDELGAAVVAGRLVRDLMRLCLLMERRYAPYSKWLGSAFGRLPVAERLTPSLRGAMAATAQPERERHLCDAYETVAALHNATGLTEPVDPARRPYHARPFMVLHAERLAAALAGTVVDPELRALPLTGSVDQWADSTDLLTRPRAARAVLAALA
ncbi:DUF4037 domain-containing protein [Streptomyces sp. SBT349]|uniref:DUF4037 domain-containing protein n=1 Tax=Streptomyces sp. SBT349 TaxID=1580539 RepID=UPI00066E0E42|nr:DUF4037 domain-containing protein [Streptomyces sp. SBT349]